MQYSCAMPAAARLGEQPFWLGQSFFGQPLHPWLVTSGGESCALHSKRNLCKLPGAHQASTRLRILRKWTPRLVSSGTFGIGGEERRVRFSSDLKDRT